jgi:hypothetical protein
VSGCLCIQFCRANESSQSTSRKRVVTIPTIVVKDTSFFVVFWNAKEAYNLQKYRSAICTAAYIFPMNREQIHLFSARKQQQGAQLSNKPSTAVAPIDFNSPESIPQHHSFRQSKCINSHCINFSFQRRRK